MSATRTLRVYCDGELVYVAPVVGDVRRQAVGRPHGWWRKRGAL